MKKIRAMFSWVGLATASVAGGTAEATPEPVLVAVPDAPVSFGYKIGWFAIKTRDVPAVVAALGLEDRRPANWQSGIDASYARDEPGSTDFLVFVSPPVDGWVFVVGNGLPLPDQRDPQTQGRGPVDRRFDRIFGDLAKHFPEVQFFSSYRVVGLVAWARARAGHVERVFAYADGEVYANVGLQSAEEKALKFFDLSGLSPLRAREAIFKHAEQESSSQKATVPAERSAIPDEEDVLAVAGAWGLNPESLEKRHMTPTVGLVARVRLQK